MPIVCGHVLLVSASPGRWRPVGLTRARTCSSRCADHRRRRPNAVLASRGKWDSCAPPDSRRRPRARHAYLRSACGSSFVPHGIVRRAPRYAPSRLREEGQGWARRDRRPCVGWAHAAGDWHSAFSVTPLLIPGIRHRCHLHGASCRFAEMRQTPDRQGRTSAVDMDRKER